MRPGEIIMAKQCLQSRPFLSGGFAAIAVLLCYSVAAETSSQTCERLAGDSVAMDSIDTTAAVSACSAAAALAPGDSKLQYEYGRALEASGKTDQAKQLYQWLATDNFSPATAALARLAGPLTGNAAEREKIAKTLAGLSSVAAHLSKAGVAEIDVPNKLLAVTGNDEQAILAWVKSQTRILPYVGSLRGASGVLMDRAGNSLDRSLLLADLLRRTGKNARIARAHVGDAAAKALRASFLEGAHVVAVPPARSKADILALIGKDPNLDANQIDEAVVRTMADAAQFNANVAKAYKTVAPALLQALGSVAAGDAKLIADADRALADHFWVQYQRNGSWADLDPDSDAVGTLQASQTFLPDQLPAELKQQVAIRVVVEMSKRGKLTDAVLIAKSMSASEVNGQSIAFAHTLYPRTTLDAISKKTNFQAAYLDDIYNANVVLPLLQIGNEIYHGQMYSFTGSVAPVTPENLAALGGTAIVNGNKLASSIASVFGSDDTGGATVTSKADVVTAEWIEISITVPGQRPATHRRMIFDLLGDAARNSPQDSAHFVVSDALRNRRALALGSSLDGIVLAAAPTENYIATKYAALLSAAFAEAGGRARDPQALLEPSEVKLRERMEVQLWSWALARSYDRALGTALPVAPNIALFWQTLVGGDQSSFAINYSFDIVSNQIVNTLKFEDQIRQGVIDTVIEAKLLTWTSKVKNTALAMSDDVAAGRTWVSSRLSAEVGQLFDQEIIVSPTGNLRNSALWWRIDSNTGNTLGIDSAGRGVAMVEYAEVLKNFVIAAGCLAVVGFNAASAPQSTGQQVIGVVRAGMCALGFGVGAFAGEVGAAIGFSEATVSVAGSVGGALTAVNGAAAAGGTYMSSQNGKK